MSLHYLIYNTCIKLHVYVKHINYTGNNYQVTLTLKLSTLTLYIRLQMLSYVEEHKVCPVLHPSVLYNININNNNF